MNTTILFIAIIIILSADFLLERFLAFLNIRHSKIALPDILKDIYNADKYARQQEYFRTNSSFGMLTSSFAFVLTFGMFVLGGFGWLDNLLASYINNEIVKALLFFAILFIANDLLTIPFEIYDIFVIETRFGFNKVTPKIFVLDKLKSLLLTTLIGGGLIALIMWIYILTPDYFWLLAWGAVTAFSLFMSLFYSEFIVPLFNKQTPLPEGELRTAIENFAGKANFKLKNIYVIDGSKRSTKANAYFTGFGPKKRIVLYDTLMDTMSNAEIVAVLAHEIGHYKHKHVIQSLMVSLPETLLMFFLLGIILKSDLLAQSLGGIYGATFELNIIAFGILYAPVTTVLGLFSNYLSRRNEYQADAFAASHTLGNELIAALKKLSSTSLSNLVPHPAYVFFHYSHPTLYQRITNITSKL
ncbi:MAG: M48 family metallopeptidase [Paludibacter sp.]|jgi:STE24 endopeptidase|nr:M48 family metallopeptidase [Paludibacter sp.]